MSHCWGLETINSTREYGQHWFSWWIVSCLAPNHYLNQCWLKVKVYFFISRKCIWRCCLQVIGHFLYILSRYRNHHKCSIELLHYCPACRTTLVATRFRVARVAVICPIIQVPHCIRVFFYFVWFVFINHIFQFYNELCTYCNILDIYLS